MPYTIRLPIPYPNFTSSVDDLRGPCLDVLVSETDVCGHKLLVTFIDEELVGIDVTKNTQTVFSYPQNADSVQPPRKAS